MSNNEQDLAKALKQGMRFLASGVCVITGSSADGQRLAMTASSVTSVSDNPPSLLVSVNKTTQINQAMMSSNKFIVNVLAKAHEQVSNNCAGGAEGEQRFSEGKWKRNELSGLYFLDDAMSVFICETKQVVPYGTHNIFIGNIVEVLVGQEHKEMLIYANGSYHYL